MKIRPTRPLLLCAFFFAALCSYASATALDPSFGVNGQVAVELGEQGSRANAVLVQPDGKIVAAGSRSGKKDRDFMLFRLLPDGSLDPDFNQDGTVTTAVSSFDDEALTLALQADGKIIAAGYSSSKENRDFAMVRYNSDGSVDSSFGATGMVVTAVGSSNDEITGVAVHEDGSIVLTGSAQGANGRVAVLARYSADGKPDSSFGEEGFTLSVVGVDAQAESVALGKDGRILLSGSYSDGEQRGLMLLGFDSKGKLDETFGEKGIAVPADSSVFSEGYGMFVNEDGTILVAGSVGGEEQRDAALFRFTAEGQPDKEFEENGVLVSAAGPEDDVLHGVAVTEGGIAAAGFKTVGGQREFLLVTYAQGEDGSLTADLLTTGFSSGKDTATALAAFGNNVVAVGESLDAAVSKAAVSMYTVDAAKTGYAKYIIGGTVVETAGVSSVSSGNQYVLTGEPYEVTRTTVIINGEVLSGAGDVTERGVVVSTLPNPSRKDKDDSDPTGAPTVTKNNPGPEVEAASATLGLSTNVDAVCKYDTAAGTAFDSMKTTFSETGAKVHSETVSNLKVGETYNYYARCKNTASGAMNTTDTVISFKVISSGTAGTTGATGGTGSGTGTSGTGTTTPTPTSVKILESMPDQFNVKNPVALSVTTADKAECKYSSVANTAFEDMTDFSISSNGGKAHSSSITLVAGEYEYYVRCKDDYSNSNEISIDFVVTPVVITETTAASFQSAVEVKLTVITDVNATCKYDTIDPDNPSDGYNLMTGTFGITGGKTHSANLGASLVAESHTYYVRCKDTSSGNSSPVGIEIKFAVTAALAPAADSLFASSDQLINAALRNVGRFFIGTAEAQVTGTTGTTGSTGTKTQTTTTDGDFIEEGYTSEGSGTGKFTSKLKKLKPGTMFYARAYAIIGGTVHYGNQVSFRTADSCFVATAAFGSVFHPAVQVLRDFRDQFLSGSAAGQALVNFYYRTSPPLADFISQHHSLRTAARLLLLPVTGAAWLALHLGAAALLLPLFGAVILLLVWQTLRRRTQGRAAIG